MQQLTSLSTCSASVTPSKASCVTSEARSGQTGLSVQVPQQSTGAMSRKAGAQWRRYHRQHFTEGRSELVTWEFSLGKFQKWKGCLTHTYLNTIHKPKNFGNGERTAQGTGHKEEHQSEGTVRSVLSPQSWITLSQRITGPEHQGLSRIQHLGGWALLAFRQQCSEGQTKLSVVWSEATFPGGSFSARLSSGPLGPVCHASSSLSETTWRPTILSCSHQVAWPNSINY